MKIAFLITKSEFGGAQSYVLQLLKKLRSNHEVILATGGDGWLVDETHDLGVSTTILPELIHPIRPAQDLRACRAVHRWLERENPILLHANSSKAGLIGRIAAHRANIPCVFTAHGWAFTGGASWKRKMIAIPAEWSAARFGGEIICVSRYDHDLALKHHITSPDRLHVVWNGVEDGPARAPLAFSSVPVLTMVARFSPPKDHEILLRSMVSLADLEWRLRFVGDGPLLANTKRLADNLGIGSRVEFLGARNDVPDLLAKSNLFVLTSRFEGLPISIIEAMRARLPIVASHVGGIPELVDETNGILVSNGSIDELSKTLRRLLVNRDLRVQMGQKSRERYERYFTAKQMIERTINVYETCLARFRSMK